MSNPKTWTEGEVLTAFDLNEAHSQTPRQVTSGARPSHTPGLVIHELDTGRSYISDGTDWHRLVTSGEWTTAVLSSGISVAAGSVPLRYRIIDGEWLELDGAVTANSAPAANSPLAITNVAGGAYLQDVPIRADTIPGRVQVRSTDTIVRVYFDAQLPMGTRITLTGARFRVVS